MSDTLQSDDCDAENSADKDENYSDAHGQPVRCPNCEEYVVLLWRPIEQYGGHYGFHVECDCAMGPTLNADTIEGFWPPWFPNEMDDETANRYLPENLDVRDYRGDDDE